MQKVRLGLALDGERGWHACNALGHSTVGPRGFLALLETQLGLTRVEPSHAERVVQWRACLMASRTGARFYERSFDADQFGTAATLLRWRDMWVEHGWSGTPTAGASDRIADMAAVEQLARGHLAPCIGERLGAVAAALATRPVQIDHVEVVDSLDDFSSAWRAVLDKLPVQEVAAESASPCGRNGSLLRAVQQGLIVLTAGGAAHKSAWRGDGSIRLLRSESSLAAAEWVAAQLRRCPGADRLIVAEQGGALLDAAATAADQPAQGFRDPSAFRPDLQLLPLILRLVWDPLDFTALMQFLTHPVAPVPRYARARLAEKIASTPGIGGESWARALDDIANHDAEKGLQTVADIGFWLEHPRFRAAEGAPLRVLCERVAHLAGYFQNRLPDTDDARRFGAMSGLNQCRAVQKSLETLIAHGESRLGREALDNLVAQATAAGGENAFTRAQAGAGAQVTDPGAVIEAFDTVCWWTLRAVPLITAYPWSTSEIRSLSASGVELPATVRLLDRQARGWCRPILSAREQLTLLLPAAGEELHPLWQTLESLLGNPEIERVESVLLRGAHSRGVTEVPYRALPRRRRWWQVSPGAIHGWQRRASYSSLQKFIFDPCQWALVYPAQLQPSALLDLPTDSQLYGILAHRVVEQLYRQATALDWPVSRVHSWFDQAIDAILLEAGAVLLMAGRSADRERLRHGIRRALGVLHQQLQAAGALRVEPEKALEADTPLGPLGGIIDLLVTFKDGGQAVVDMKWGGSAWRRDELKKHSQVQLALYARMVERNSSKWPAVAYFILKDAELLTTADGVFPGVSPVIVAAASTAQVWDRIMVSWDWRRKQLEAGRIELVSEDVEPTPESVAPDGGLAILPLNERYNTFACLAGWGADA